ncbi:hypothetical protein G6F50_018488 [Rhizopus delemar]|uniref:Uncharacterized protein n=1 Tax=Rhizopus delemar TaxID=936053 RepID=A0A9P6XMP2_9FUNG|nr:hypothetical protein G6F50_018488 [Rhizopus delemar]
MSSFSCASDGPTEYEPIICDTLTRSTFGGCEPGATPGTCWPLRAIPTWRRAASVALACSWVSCGCRPSNERSTAVRRAATSISSAIGVNDLATSRPMA